MASASLRRTPRCRASRCRQRNDGTRSGAVSAPLRDAFLEKIQGKIIRNWISRALPSGREGHSWSVRSADGFCRVRSGGDLVFLRRVHEHADVSEGFKAAYSAPHALGRRVPNWTTGRKNSCVEVSLAIG